MARGLWSCLSGTLQPLSVLTTRLCDSEQVSDPLWAHEMVNVVTSGPFPCPGAGAGSPPALPPPRVWPPHPGPLRGVGGGDLACGAALRPAESEGPVSPRLSVTRPPRQARKLQLISSPKQLSGIAGPRAALARVWGQREAFCRVLACHPATAQWPLPGQQRHLVASGSCTPWSSCCCLWISWRGCGSLGGSLRSLVALRTEEAYARTSPELCPSAWPLARCVRPQRRA